MYEIIVSKGNKDCDLGRRGKKKKRGVMQFLQLIIRGTVCHSKGEGTQRAPTKVREEFAWPSAIAEVPLYTGQ